MNQVMTQAVLEQETATHRGTGGISAENRSFGFHPAFFDTETAAVYVCSYADRRPAPFHMLDGLPDEVVLTRTPSGRVARVKASITSGFVRGGRFYSREEAARQVEAACSPCQRAA